MNLRLVAKADLGLGRMHVHVNERGVYLDENERHGMPVAHEQVPVCSIERVGEGRVLD